MSFHGGLIGIIIAIWFFSKKNSVNFFQLSDLVSSVAPIGLFLVVRRLEPAWPVDLVFSKNTGLVTTRI